MTMETVFQMKTMEVAFQMMDINKTIDGDSLGFEQEKEVTQDKKSYKNMFI